VQSSNRILLREHEHVHENAKDKNAQASSHRGERTSIEDMSQPLMKSVPEMDRPQIVAVGGREDDGEDFKADASYNHQAGAVGGHRGNGNDEFHQNYDKV
jgi:hypothetical protein